ncbi:MAG: AAA family ATPase, partial [Deltaproteobacteria bacterium]|nr:AAA family ATPase [Deltaproteobacteria bacterium]
MTKDNFTETPNPNPKVAPIRPDIPPGEPDVDEEEARLEEDLAAGHDEEQQRYQQNKEEAHPILNITDWSTNRFMGTPPERQMLVDELIPLGKATILAAPGGAGKGLLSLNLALGITLGPTGGRKFCGHDILVEGSAVIFTAEDDMDEIHLRLNSLATQDELAKVNGKLFVIPLPNAGGVNPIATQGPQGPEATPFFSVVKEQIKQIPDIKLIVFDPLSSFAFVDVNKDPQAAAFVTGLMAELATETGATVILSHHFSKTGEVVNIRDAKNAVRGSTGLVNGVRCVF